MISSETGRRRKAPIREAKIPEAKPAVAEAGLRDAILYALLFCVTLFAYFPALNGKLLWDDDAHITRPAMRTLHGLWQTWFDLGATQQYYPLLHNAFWIEHRFWGDAVLGYHLVNIALHSLAACLVVAIVRRLALPGAWLAGFIFALHPICVEAVAWISEQKSTLSTVFYLGAALTYLNFDRTRRKSRYLVALGLFVLALLSKTVTATLPAALLVVFWWQRGRLRWRHDVIPLLPWLALGAAAGLFTAAVERKYIGAQGADYALTLLQRFLIAGRAIWFYAGKLLWPENLTFVYPHWTIDSSVWWQYLFPAAAVAVAAGLWRVARKHRGPLAAFLFFAGTLFPVLGFFNVYPFLYSYVADHFQYLASLGIIIPLAWGLTVVMERRGLPPAMAALLPAILGSITWSQSHMYRDAETLYRETLARNPDCWMAHNNLGSILSKKPDRLAEAETHFEAALRIRPDYPEAHTNLGLAFSKMGRLPDAIHQYEDALRIRPDDADAHYNLGLALATIPSRLPDAVAEYRAALRTEPDSVETHSNLGLVLSEIPGRMPDAIAEYQAALGIDPDAAAVHNNLGRALSRMPGRLSDAIAEYQAALRLQPEYPEAQVNLGLTLSRIPGRMPEAIEHIEAALRMRPDSAEVHTDMGSVLLRIPGRTTDAIAELQSALRINPDLAEAHFNLAGALSDIPGRLPDAIAEYEAAIRIRPDYAEAHNNLGLILRDIPHRLPDAVAEFETVIRIDPGSVFAQYNLGVALSKIPGRMTEAIGHLETALRISPDAAPVRQMLERLRTAPGEQGR
jgi:protein O-mannosyl-transferase